MREERRKTRRARLPGLRVTYESAAGLTVEAEAIDIGTDGVFLRSAAPLAVGQRLSLEMSLAGEPARWSAIGRVVRTRATDTAEGPAGMGVKFIDVDDEFVARVGHLVATAETEQTDPGTGGLKTPAHEPTMVGVGEGAVKAPLAVQPIVTVGYRRERTMLGVGVSAEPPEPHAQEEPPPEGWDSAEPPQPSEPSLPLVLEQSVAIDLVARKSSVPPPETTEEPAPVKEPETPEESVTEAKPISDESLAAAGVPRRRRWGWLVLLVVLALAGAAIYQYRGRIPWQLHRLRYFVEKHLGR
jgi:uncharacterized protein (TIGR02266 family)